MANQDKIVQELIKKAKEKKEAIKKAERPNWKTNMSFPYNTSSSSRLNLQVASDTTQLVEVVSHILTKGEYWEKATKLIGVKTKFKIGGFTKEDWIEDIKTRITILELHKKKKELEIIEKRLDSLISPELRRQMELEEIQNLLDD